MTHHAYRCSHISMTNSEQACTRASKKSKQFNLKRVTNFWSNALFQFTLKPSTQSQSRSQDHLLIRTTPHGLDLQPTKTKTLSDTAPTIRKNFTVTMQGMSVENFRPEATFKYLGQRITFKRSIQVDFEHRINCAWATLRSHRQGLTTTTNPLKDRVKLFDATVTPRSLKKKKNFTQHNGEQWTAPVTQTKTTTTAQTWAATLYEQHPARRRHIARRS